MTISDWIHTAPEIETALAEGRPVVALETAVVSHGLPHEHALVLAARMDAAVREGGAIPAFVGVFGGRVQLGVRLSDMDALLAKDAVKVAERDLAVVIAQRRTGGTTVSATLAVAASTSARRCRDVIPATRDR